MCQKPTGRDKEGRKAGRVFPGSWGICESQPLISKGLLGGCLQELSWDSGAVLAGTRLQHPTVLTLEVLKVSVEDSSSCPGLSDWV